METKRLPFFLASIIIMSAVLACSLIPKLLTDDSETHNIPSDEKNVKDKDENEDNTTDEKNVTDGSNERNEEKKEPIVGEWEQIDITSLTNNKNIVVYSGTLFGAYRYVATQPKPYNNQTQGAELWRTRDGATWEMVGEPGMGNPENHELRVYVWKDHLYVAANGNYTYSIWESQDGETFQKIREGDKSQKYLHAILYVVGDHLVLLVMPYQEGVQGWVSADGKNFEKVFDGGMGNPKNFSFCSLTGNELPILNGWSYLCVRNNEDGGEIWRSKDGIEWEKVLTGGYDDATNASVMPEYLFNNYLYAIAYNANGVNIFRTDDGKQWKKVVSNGFDIGKNQASMGWFNTYKGDLYLLTTNDDPRIWGGIGVPKPSSNGMSPDENGTAPENAQSDWSYSESFPLTGFRLWKSTDGKSWEQISDPGFGNPNNFQGIILTIRDVFYLVAFNYHDGNQIWRSTDGENWEVFYTFPASPTNEGGGLVEYRDSLLYHENDIQQGIQYWRYGP
jgi:hypothetical protein